MMKTNDKLFDQKENEMEIYSDCKFELINPNIDSAVPKRATKYSAGYDIAVTEGAVLKPGESKIFHTNVRALMPPNMFLYITIRSGMGLKRHLILTNQVGTIDSDYQKEILIGLTNAGDKPQTIVRGDRVVQGIFLQYARVAGDNLSASAGERTGGFGSTGD